VSRGDDLAQHYANVLLEELNSAGQVYLPEMAHARTADAEDDIMRSVGALLGVVALLAGPNVPSDAIVMNNGVPVLKTPEVLFTPDAGGVNVPDASKSFQALVASLRQQLTASGPLSHRQLAAIMEGVSWAKRTLCARSARIITALQAAGAPVARIEAILTKDAEGLFQWARRYSYCFQLADALPTKDYWNVRYATGGSSGLGSYGHLARYKAAVLNEFVRLNEIRSVVDLGCGDGNQAGMLEVEHYLGLDVSEAAIRLCEGRFPDRDDRRRFHVYAPGALQWRGDLAISLDVIYHLVDDDTFETYMADLFTSATAYVAIYSSNIDSIWTDKSYHIRHRRYSAWVERHVPEWHGTAAKTIEAGDTPCRFVFFAKTGSSLVPDIRIDAAAGASPAFVGKSQAFR
jgi:SAM-dependent methyltransferase